jgi:hypothetical protein
MPDWSRRRALQALGAAAVGAVAGCSGGGGFEDSPRGDREPVYDYAVRKVRRSDGGAVFWQSEDGDGTDEADEERRAVGYAYVSSSDDFEDVSFARDSDAAARLASFVAATDFESSSVLLQGSEVRECYELRLQGVFRDGDDLETDFCSALRPADVACSRERRHTVAVAIRVPFSLADASGFGSSWGSGCHGEPTPVGGAAADSGGGGS